VISTPAPEPTPSGWAVRDARLVVRRLLDIAGDTGQRPVVVAVDGRSGSGKSTVADRIAGLVPGAVVVRTDDVAWHHSFFDWDGLLAEHVLEPVRSGEDVDYRPPGWESHDREGAIEVPASASMVVIEGVGSSRGALADRYDAIVWVSSDEDERRRRGVIRDVELGRSPEDAEAFWDEWDSAELPFLADDRPWERAHVVVCGTPELIGLAPGHDDLVVVSSAATAAA
jgi:uridine kinase